ncbi:MAG: hypothetical protein H6597_06600 [Flavobacteriales bacterium]|nr:hypothetical protein [Flavobacteriales bacterium]MCB9194186.1 hypothetical protein [Flavobacteriales bacterium]
MLRRLTLSILMPLLVPGLRGQDVTPGLALGHASSVSLPMSKAMVYARALEAWRSIIALEPGATLITQDPDAGIIEGTARIRFRSEALAGREQTMGNITYRIRIQALHGECRIAFTSFRHTGNPGATRGPIDLGTLTASGPPLERPPGLSWSIASRIMDEARTAALDRALTLTRHFEASLRTGNAR